MVSNERSISISVWNDVSFVNEKQFREGMGLGHANNRKITLLLGPTPIHISSDRNTRGGNFPQDRDRKLK